MTLIATTVGLAHRRIVGAQVTAVVEVSGAPTLVLSSGHKIAMPTFPSTASLKPLRESTIVGVVPTGDANIVAIIFHMAGLRAVTIEVLAKQLLDTLTNGVGGVIRSSNEHIEET